MRPRDIRYLAVTKDGLVVASDGARHIDRLEGGWFARWRQLPRDAQVTGLTAVGGSVLACDSGNACIWQIDDSGVAPFAGSPQPRSLGLSHRSSDGTTDDARFRSLTSIALMSEQVAAAEIGPHGPIIRIVAGGRVTSFETGGEPLNSVDSLAPAMSGLYAVSTGVLPIIIYMVNEGSCWVSRIHAGARHEAGDTDGRAENARFARPVALAAALTGGCLVADGARIRAVSDGGDVRTLAGGAPGFCDGAGSDARFGPIQAIAVDTSNRVIVADVDNSAVRSIAPDGFVTTLVGGPNPVLLNEIEAENRRRHFSHALVDDDPAEAWALARDFIADHNCRGSAWPDRTIQPVSSASARVGKNLADRWSESADSDRARLGRFCMWLILCDERESSVDELRDARLRRLGEELFRIT